MDAAPADAFIADACASCTDAAAPGDAASSNDLAGADASGLLPFMARCTDNGQCASGLCHPYPARGASFCTIPCTRDGDCPAPSPGCNGMGVCKAP
jgi:hypothetical protein